MKVLMSPVFEGNQYQRLLVAALEERGVDVSTGVTARPPATFVWRVLLESPDVVHLHWTHPYFLLGTDDWPYRLPGARLLCSLLALVFLVEVRLTAHLCDRLVWTVHNRCNHERRYPELDRKVGVRVARDADVLQAWDERTRTEIADRFEVPESRIEVVPHGNYCPLYDQEVDPTNARERLGVSGYDRILLYFGMIRPYKRVPRLIETFSAMDPEGACLVVAGNPMQEALAEEVRHLAAADPDVRPDLRYIPEDEVPTFFAAADFAVLPYEHVFSSGSVLLAMSLSTAVVAPPEGCLPSVLPPGNVLYDDLESGIEAAVTADDATVAAVGERNREAAERNHDWETVAGRTIDMYRGRGAES